MLVHLQLLDKVLTIVRKNKQMKATQNIRTLVPYGGVKQIAEKLGLTQQAVSLALKAGRPSHPAVQEAMRLAEASGALIAAQSLAKLPSPVAQAA